MDKDQEYGEFDTFHVQKSHRDREMRGGRTRNSWASQRQSSTSIGSPTDSHLCVFIEWVGRIGWMIENAGNCFTKSEVVAKDVIEQWRWDLLEFVAVPVVHVRYEEKVV
jgi:hypothetical protein